MKNSKIAPADEPGGTPMPGPANAPHRILVVEDDADIRSLNAQVLKLYGYLVDAAEDGSAAWDTLQQKSYDLVITDNEMPKVTGVELLKKLYAAGMPLPVIMATGQLPEEEFTRHPWLKPIVMLLKPYTIEELLEKVKEVLRTAYGGRKLSAPPQ